MKISQTQKIIFAIVMFSLTGFILYKTFFSSDTTTTTLPVAMANVPGSNTVTTSSTTDQTQGQDILDLANKLDTISIDSALFSSPLFKNLKDFDVPLSPELQGRPNPFAVIGSDINFQSVSTTSKSQVKSSH